MNTPVTIATGSRGSPSCAAPLTNAAERVRRWQVTRPNTEVRSLRILAVDDDAIVLLNTVTMLEDMGHAVTERHSGSEAIESLEGEQFDLLLSDYAMPGMNGGELVRRARDIQPAIRAAIVSGYADLPEGTALDVPRLAKPFTQDDLSQLIARLTA